MQSKYRVHFSKKFKQSYKKINRNDKALVDAVSRKLANDEILEPKYRDHALKRNPNKLQRIYDELALLKTIKKEKYDMVIGLTSGERSAFLAFWSGAKIRVGFPPNSF